MVREGEAKKRKIKKGKEDHGREKWQIVVPAAFEWKTWERMAQRSPENLEEEV